MKNTKFSLLKIFICFYFILFFIYRTITHTQQSNMQSKKSDILLTNQEKKFKTRTQQSNRASNESDILVTNQEKKFKTHTQQLNDFSNESELPIISLTTQRKRFKTLNNILNHFLNQTAPIYKMFLVVDNFDVSYLPKEVNDTIKKSGKIELFISNLDIKPHKKYYFSMQIYKNNPIVLVDDDCYFEPNALEEMMKLYKKNKKVVIAARTHLVTYDKNGQLNNYEKWKHEYKNETSPSCDLFPTGVGGVLYPPYAIKKMNISKDNLNDIYKYLYNDDFYLKALTLKNKLKVQKVPLINKWTCIDQRFEDQLTFVNLGLYGNNNKYIKSIELDRLLQECNKEDNI